MKFGKSLSNQIEETLPEWRDKFLSYKHLKKHLKSINSKEGERCSKRQRLAAEDREENAMTEEEIDFIRLLEDELEKFNFFFGEKEEEYVIKLKLLQDRVTKAKDSNEELVKIGRQIVDFHGEMVLLENYSALNYTGLMKILKKYEKRTGSTIRLPFIQKVLQQPFFTTDVLYKLLKACEAMIDSLFAMNKPPVAGGVADDVEGCSTDPTTTKKEDLLRRPEELAEIEYMESLFMKHTLSALRALKEIRSGSSTVSMFSLPPLQTSGLEEKWNKVPFVESAAE